MKRGNGPILFFFSNYSFFKDQSWGLQLAARRSWQLHLFRLGHRLPSNSLLFVPGKCDSAQRFQAENSVCLFFKDFYWLLLLSFLMCLEGTHWVQSLSAPIFVIQKTFIKPVVYTCPYSRQQGCRDVRVLLPVQRSRQLLRESGGPDAVGVTARTHGPPWGVREDALEETGGTRQITRDLGSGHIQQERWREIKGQCGISCSHSSFQSLQQSTFWWVRREHLERVRITTCGALALGEMVHPSGFWQVKTERSTHGAGSRDQWH